MRARSRRPHFFGARTSIVIWTTRAAVSDSTGGLRARQTGANRASIVRRPTDAECRRV